MTVLKVISGGQTGVDQMGLKVAKVLGIPTGGTAPKGYLTELGPSLMLRDEYGLVEDESPDYPPRTKKNVLDADATVLFGNMESTGSKETIKCCKACGRPYIPNPTVEELVIFLQEWEVKVLNVAGNRGSRVSTLKLLEYGHILAKALKQA